MSRLLECALDAERRAACLAHDADLQRSVRTVTRAARMVTTPAGITIGIAYEPPKPQPSRDHERIQAALLEPRTADPMPPLLRLFAFLWSKA